MGRLALLYRMILRPLVRQPGRALLIVFAVALGDAAVVAIDLAGDAAAGSFRSSMETLTGRNDLEVTAAGGVPEGVVARVATLPFAVHLSPRIEDHATVTASGETVPLIGIDLVGEVNAEGTKALDDAELKESFRHINDADAIRCGG
jgi:putative ABC transport system permease protein